MKPATCASTLLRAHLRALAPLPKRELAALMQVVNELGAVGRNLNQIARAMNQGARVAGPTREELRAILKACAGLRDHVDAREEPGWLDIVSYGRRGPGQRGPLRPYYEAIARTTSRVPEVMVKVTGGGRNVRQVRDEISYFGRKGKLEIETDDGQRLQGAGIDKQIIEDWDLDLEGLRGCSPYDGKSGRRSPKIVYNLMFSMPPGTPPQKVWAAAKKFALEKFALSHRYAMVLHTDERHPHVHMLVKARSEEGVRLHITKPMLREWRQEFARYLRELGVAANATDRKSRGQTKPRKLDGIYRAHLRGESSHMRERAEAVEAEMLKGRVNAELGKVKLIETRRAIEHGWRAVRAHFDNEKQFDLANRVIDFLDRIPVPRTEKEHIAIALAQHVKRRHTQERHSTR